MDRVNGFVVQTGRVALQIVLMAALLAMFALDWKPVSPALQLVLFKVLLVTMGFLHAHIIRKLAFPKISWDLVNSSPHLKWLAVSLYVIVIWAYARGG